MLSDMELALIWLCYLHVMLCYVRPWLRNRMYFYTKFSARSGGYVRACVSVCMRL